MLNGLIRTVERDGRLEETVAAFRSATPWLILLATPDLIQAPSNELIQAHLELTLSSPDLTRPHSTSLDLA